jgi:amino acid adenylation domain-containing protein
MRKHSGCFRIKVREYERKAHVSDAIRNTTKLPPEQEAIRARCFHPSGRFVEFPKEDVETSIPERFEKIVDVYPHRLAIKTGDRSLTYAELNQQANRVAHAILERRGPGDEPIALMCEDKIHEITAILGVLKAGKFYVPLDVGYPKQRNAFFLTDSTAAIIVCDAQGIDRASEIAAKKDSLIGIENLNSNVSDENLKLSISPEALAFIMYTSGSTGEPKGIIENHKNMLYEVMCYTNKIHVCQEDRLTLLHSLSFRASKVDFYGSLLNGTAIFPYDVKHEGASYFAQWLSDERITIFHSTPSVFRLLTENITDPEKICTVRLVHLSGAAVNKRDAELWEKHFQKPCLFLHTMGTTETQIVSWRFTERSADIPGIKLPLGWPPEGKLILILDEKRDEVGLDQVGEIAVKSRHISLGYWNKPEMTKSKFLPDLNGTDERIYLTGDLGYQTAGLGLFHLGRKDLQIKVRGYRIDASEIEVALGEHVGVKEVAVVGHETRVGDSYLIAYVMPVDKPGPSISELRGFLKARLPNYMVPSAFVYVDALPLTPNGKVDRNALPAPDSARPELDTRFVAPRTTEEKKLAKIWAEVLDLDQVGVHDNFFDLGGHSLTASRVISRVVKTFRLELPIKALFDSPTVAEMTVVITKNMAKKAGDEELARMLSELESLSDEEVQRRLAEEGK